MSREIINVGGAISDPAADNARVSFTKVNSNFEELYNVISSTSDLTQDASHNRATVLMSGDNLTYTLANGLAVENGAIITIVQNGNNLTIDGAAVNLTTPQTLQSIDGATYFLIKTGTTTGTDNYIISQVGASSGSGNFSYATDITSTVTTLDGTQEGLNTVYPFNSASAQTVTITTGDYVTNDVINIERRGQGSVEIIADTGVYIRGVRNLQNRYFINDPNSMVSLTCRGSEEFTIIGNLTRGYTGAVTTSSYGSLSAGDTNKSVAVVGTGFSSNMKDPVITGNATLVSWTFTDENNITLFLTATGINGDNITVTYDNGDVFVDTNAITLSAALTDSIISGYNLDANANDNTGTNNGTATAVSYVSGQVSNAADFDGSTSYIDIPDAANLSFGDGSTDSPFSISFGVKFDSTASCYLIAKRQSPDDKEYQIDLLSGTLRVILFDQSSGGTLNAGFTPSFSTATWYHVVMTYDGSSTFGGINFYIDGSAQSLSDSSAGSYTAMENLTSQVRLGAKPFVLTDSILDGQLDEVYFWDKELSAAEVTEIYDDFNSGIALV